MTTEDYLKDNAVPATEANISLCILGRVIASVSVALVFCRLVSAGYFGDEFTRFSPPVRLLGCVAPLLPPALVWAACWPWLRAVAVAARDCLCVSALLYVPYYLFVELVLPHRFLYVTPHRVAMPQAAPFWLLLGALSLLVGLIVMIVFWSRSELPADLGEPGHEGPDTSADQPAA